MKCPECGEKMLKQYIAKGKGDYEKLLCPNCYMEMEVPASKPPIGIKPYYVFYAERVCDLADAISRHADNADDHCVNDWMRELHALRIFIHSLKKLFSQNEYWEEDLASEDKFNIHIGKDRK